MLSVSPSQLVQFNRMLLLALAYFLAGRIALLLAIPPGFVTALFPPLGISLAAVLLWGSSILTGVFVGSLILNVSLALSGGADFGITVLLVASEIAVGSCLAAGVGAILIKKWVGFPNGLMDEWSIFIFFFIGGPLTSAISASVGVLTLYLNGLNTVTQIPYSWITWWTGDAMGVLIAAPLVFILFAQPRLLWRNRIKTVGVPLIISCGFIVSVFITTAKSEQQKIERSFYDSANEISNMMFSEFTKNVVALFPLKGLYLASSDVTQEDFRLFTADMLTNDKSITALSWNQFVPSEKRSIYEQSLRNAGIKEFSIRERNNAGELIYANERNHYVVVTYIEPYAQNKSVQGYDVGSEPVRNKAISIANKTGFPTMTAPITLLQDDSKKLNFLIFMPVYRTLDAPKTVQLREEQLQGYVTALIRVDTKIESIHNSFSGKYFSIRLEDITEYGAPVTLYDDENVITKTPALNFTESKVIAGRKLALHIFSTDSYLAEQRTSQSWYVLVGGLLFSSLLGGFLLLVTGRAEYIGNLVEHRTLELESILDGTVEAIIIINQHGLIERANSAACRLFKSKDHLFVGLHSVSVIPILHELLFSPEKTIEVTGSKSLLKAKETIGVCADNARIPIEIGVSQVDLPDRKIFTCVIHDITARKKVDSLKSEFVSTVSHELRTPLTSIGGALGLLVAGGIPNIPPKAMDLLVIAKNNSDRLGRLVNDILDIEKLEFGKINLELSACDANDLMRKSMEQNTGYATKYGVHLALDNVAIVEAKLIILVDEHRFLQVMSNLISNAIKFSQMDGIVTLSAKKSDGFVTFYVEDYGTGIPEEFRNKIFQKFAQADGSDTRKRDGTGLGLSISKAIVERMGGVINYRTEVHKGSVFFFSIPVEYSEPI